MTGYDFSYDGVYLSDFDCIMCSFDGTDVETAPSGSQITFNTTPVYNGQKHLLASSTYEECISIDIQICKDPCSSQPDSFSAESQREIMRWLNRKDFHELVIFSDNEESLYFEGSFNIEQIRFGHTVIGYQLHFTSNRPFALGEEMIHIFDIGKGQSYTLYDTSDEIGYLYPDVTVTSKEAGKLAITNSMDEQRTVISNLSSGETIHMDNMIIESSLPSHQATLMNDFNFHFLRISNTYTENRNILTFSLPCSVQIRYRPVRKLGV